MYESTKKSLLDCVRKVEAFLAPQRWTKKVTIPEYIQIIVSNASALLYKLSSFAEDENIEASFNVVPDVDGTMDIEIHYNGKSISFTVDKNPKRLDVVYFNKDISFEETVTFSDLAKCVNWLVASI